MRTTKKVRVLIVDDSLVFRETLAKGISVDDGIEVVATAENPFIARDKIIEFEPDVITLDVEMPKMNGIEFLKRLMPQYPLPVVVVSSISDNVFDALNAGAVDFVTKPDLRIYKNIDSFINELIIKIKIASISKVGHMKSRYISKEINGKIDNKNNCRIIAIGASTGGTEATFEIIKAFPREMPGIVVTQHMPAVFTNMYAKRLNNSCKMEVKEAENGDLVIPGRVLIAPGDFQMKVNNKGNGIEVEIFKGEKVNGHSPSVDVLFNSVADCVGASSIGVILTGMGYDGAKGLLKMKRKGALTIGQDERSCVVYGMPKAAYEVGAIDRQAGLKDIPELIYCAINKEI